MNILHLIVFRVILLLVPIYLIILLLFHPVLSVYFSQDDFFHFKVSQTDGSWQAFLKLFGFHPFQDRGIAFYRPIFREALYNLYYLSFGLNHIPFRILSLTLHLINITLVFFLIQRIFKNRFLAWFVTLFTGISASNVGILYYLAGGIQAIGATLFLLLTLHFYLSYLQKHKIKYLAFSFITFVAGLGSHELATTIPILLLLLTLTTSSIHNFTQKAFGILPFFIALIPYLYLDLVRIGFSSSEKQYDVVFNIKTYLNSLAWYYTWALGLPEMLIDFVTPELKLNPTLMRYWGHYYKVIFPTFTFGLFIILMVVLYLGLKFRNILTNKLLWLLILWFPITISPVILLPQHKSTYYLAPALPAFWGSFLLLLFTFNSQIKDKFPKMSGFLLGTTLGMLLVLNIVSTELGSNTHWAASRGKLAQKLITQVKTRYPTLPKGATIYFVNDPSYPYVAKDWGASSKQAYFALNGSDALQLLYKDSSLSVMYEDFHKLDFPTPKRDFFSLVVKIE